MSLEVDIIKAIKAEGYRINENIRDALDEFLEVIRDENEEMEIDAEEEIEDEEAE